MTLVAVVGAFAVQREASRPIGEGALFYNDASIAATRVAATAPQDLADEIRHIRNALEVESVSIVGPGGIVELSSSGSLVDNPVDNPIVRFGHASQVFAAAAIPISLPIAVDGVVEWSAGDTLYEVSYPLGSERSLLLHYDVSELLERRSRAGGISAETLTLLAVAIAGVVVAAISLLARSRAKTRFRILERESALLREHAEELEIHNIELELARNEAERALALAQEKNRIRGEFVMMINHELRTPLTSMLTGAQILSENGLDSDSSQAIVTAMLEDGGRLESMIGQILSVARIENRGLNSTVVDTESGAIWDAIVGQLPIGTVIGDAPSNPTAPLRTDATTLSQLVVSLVENAEQHGATEVTVTASSEGSVSDQVSVGSVESVGLVISVTDDGPGISEAFLPRVFEKFEKDSFSSGTGLGLYIVGLMAEAIHSSVRVATSAQGTTFEILIPSVPAHVEVREMA